jgi:hypothetical protein
MAAAIWSLVLLAGARRRSEFVASGALLVSGWMIYEATWFLWVPAVMVLLAVARKRGPVPKAFWLQVACVAGAQVVFVAANRLLASLSATSKKISGDILGTMGTNQHLFKEQLGRQFHDVWLPVAIALAVLAGTALVVALSRRVLPGLLLRVAACAIGIALAVLMYAAASYAIQWEGLFARTTLPISFWLALLAGLLVQAAERAGSSVVRWVGRGSALAACAVFALVLVRESAPWQESWQEQQAVVRSFPAELLRVADHRTVVLIDLPHGPAPVYGFGAYWDISGALSAMLPPERTNTPMPYAFATVLRESELRTGWDGHNVRQAWCSAPENALWQLPAERVFVWRYPGQEVLPVAPGFATGCKPLKQG